jgi:hypothetical protein
MAFFALLGSLFATEAQIIDAAFDLKPGPRRSALDRPGCRRGAAYSQAARMLIRSVRSNAVSPDEHAL